MIDVPFAANLITDEDIDDVAGIFKSGTLGRLHGDDPSIQ